MFNIFLKCHRKLKTSYFWSGWSLSCQSLIHTGSQHTCSALKQLIIRRKRLDTNQNKKGRGKTSMMFNKIVEISLAECFRDGIKRHFVWRSPNLYGIVCNICARLHGFRQIFLPQTWLIFPPQVEELYFVLNMDKLDKSKFYFSTQYILPHIPS